MNIARCLEDEPFSRYLKTTYFCPYDPMHSGSAPSALGGLEERWRVGRGLLHIGLLVALPMLVV